MQLLLPSPPPTLQQPLSTSPPPTTATTTTPNTYCCPCNRHDSRSRPNLRLAHLQRAARDVPPAAQVRSDSSGEAVEWTQTGAVEVMDLAHHAHVCAVARAVSNHRPRECDRCLPLGTVLCVVRAPSHCHVRAILYIALSCACDVVHNSTV